MENSTPPSKKDNGPGIFARLLDTLVGLGLGESLIRTGTTLLSVVLLAGVIWLLRIFYAQGIQTTDNQVSALETVPTVAVGGADIQQASYEAFDGIPRLAQVHTTIPSRPRQEIEKYTVVEGD